MCLVSISPPQLPYYRVNLPQTWCSHGNQQPTGWPSFLYPQPQKTIMHSSTLGLSIISH